MSPFIQNMITVLSDKILKFEKVEGGANYSDDKSYKDVIHAMYLNADMTFRYKVASFKNVFVAGYILPQQDEKEYFGVWKITYENDKIYLVFTFEDDTQQKYETENMGVGMQRLGAQVWSRYRMG